MPVGIGDASNSQFRDGDIGAAERLPIGRCHPTGNDSVALGSSDAGDEHEPANRGEY
jgi:hypothetical protein